MYRSYVRAQAAASVAAESERRELTDYTLDDDDVDEFDETVRNEVRRVWQVIEKQCNDYQSQSSKETTETVSETAQEWNTVHVFVSSTFTDFFCEREVLVKKVFPELREWCHGRGLRLIECDLRWGIPKDTSTADVILVCLDEIERCREVNKGQPFFINLMGERYGWIPTAEETPDEAVEKYGWVEGSSITFMEILNGAYRAKNPNAAFFPRDRSVCDAIPESFHKRFKDMEPIARLHLKALKKKIQEKFPEQVFPYCPTFKQISTASGREQVELTDLDEFADNVTKCLKTAIERMYPAPHGEESEVDVVKQETNLQWLFALDKAKDLIGRHAELEILKEFVEYGTSSLMEETVGENASVRNPEEWDMDESDHRICVLDGQSGWGKTALVSKLIVDTVKSGAKVFFHIVNSTPSSNRVDNLLRRLLSVIIAQPSEEEKSVMESGNVDDLKKLLRTGLSSYRSQDNPKLVLILDAVNELENNETQGHLSWLPPMFPSNIHCIVSTNPHPPTTARLDEHPTLKLSLRPMSQEDLAKVVVRYLEAFNKKLDAGQLETLVSKTKANNPLWMLLMAEELRIFGDFRLMDSKIKNFPDTMEGLLVQIIDRLIQEDDENDVIRKCLSLIGCSRHGLPLENVLEILGNLESKEELAPLYWARARRALKPYLRVFGRGEEVITFSHEAVSKAVQNHLLASQEDLVEWHTVLADYYQHWCQDGRARAYHLPYHLERAGLKKRLVDFMQKDPDSYTKMNTWNRSQIMKSVRCQRPAGSKWPGSETVILCSMCAHFSRGFNPACHWQNKNCCVVCGALCQGFNTVFAHACIWHGHKMGTHSAQCVLCNRIVSLPSHGNHTFSEQAKLCMQCGFGHFGNTCARFDV